MIRAIVGANWGDEGKGKITDMFAAKSDIVIRFQGGANAGHTIINEHGRFAFHLMPSGVCYDHTTCIIGNGVALDINKFITELEDVKAAGLNPHLLVSERCQILMPYHICWILMRRSVWARTPLAPPRAALPRSLATSSPRSVFR